MGSTIDNTNIELQGYIDDVSAFFAQGDVAINPTFEGTGLKIKTFESMSYDKVVMVHPHSTIGVYKKDSAPLFSSNEPNEWVNFLKRIWNNTKEMQEIKSQTHKYLNEMNDFIKMEYKKFLEI
ncbi:MAG: glycosyltransferase family 4 protein [Paludibacteraceae bacterium]|nr:glycosyltransferase family 4 protein [Paludibacteraceae bacterium]